MSFDNSISSKIDWKKMDALYEAEEIARRKEAILRSDTEKFLHFTKMIRINNTLKRMKVTHKKMM
jgi:hypothetical protein